MLLRCPFGILAVKGWNSIFDFNFRANFLYQFNFDFFFPAWQMGEQSLDGYKGILLEEQHWLKPSRDQITGRLLGQ